MLPIGTSRTSTRRKYDNGNRKNVLHHPRTLSLCYSCIILEGERGDPVGVLDVTYRIIVAVTFEQQIVLTDKKGEGAIICSTY